jgi:HEAT repeat protein
VLNDPNQSSKNRLAMMGQLPALGAKAKPALRALTEACNDSSVEIRKWAVEAIRRIGPDAAPAVDTLIPLLHDEKFTVRLGTMWALQAIGPPARRAVPLLLEELKRNDSLTRQTAAQALAGIGPAARESLPVLMEMRTETDQETLRVAEAIWKVGQSAEVPVSRLVGLLQSHNVSIGREAARLLGEIGPAAKPAVPALRAAANNSQLQPDAEEALKKIDTDAAAHLNDK